jgi:hypothetical protein
MTLPFSIDGARVVIPGVYDILRVQASIPAPVATGRSILVLGESEEGIPGDQLDLRLNFFTDFQSVQSFYKSGPIVDSARQIFSSQPSPVFSGAVQRMYVWKTNATTRANKAIVSPTGYGTLHAAKYGEDGNMIKSQIKALSEVLPTKTFSFLPSAEARALKVSVNGVVTSIPVPAEGDQTGLATVLGTISGLSASGGAPKTVLAAPVLAVVVTTASGDLLTLTKAGAFGATLAIGDTVVIPTAGVLAGAGDANAGVYVIVNRSAGQLQIRKVKQWQPLADSTMLPADVAISPVDLDPADLSCWGPLTVSATDASPAGVGASLEIAMASGGIAVNGMTVDMSAMSAILTDAAAGLASVAVTAPELDSLSLVLSNAQWSTVPKVGDVVQIRGSSMLAGALSENVGLHVVTAASPTTMTIKSTTGIAVDAAVSGAVAGDTEIILSAAGLASSSVAAKTLKSASESKVWIDATNIKTGQTFPTSSIGGTVCLELGVNDGVTTSATVEISSLGVMTIVAGARTITVRLNKYKSLQNLCDFLNTQSGVAAKVMDNRLKNLPTSVLDQVAATGCMAAHSGASGNARLKADYYYFSKFIADNFGLLAFAAGAMAQKAGLPAAEGAATFLTGAVVGATSDASIQKGLDESLKIDVRVVLPLFSRDAIDDIDDGMTDPGSSWLIDGIHAAVKSHCATAATIKVRRERYGQLSIHESFDASIEKCSGLAYERLQMSFMMCRAIDGQGAIQWFLPWMGACVIAAGRAQAGLGTSMLRKPFGVTSVKHIGKKSIFDDTLQQDFDPENQGQLEQAIEAGLVVFRAVPGFGVRMESPDLSTRSRENDPEGWVWERINVLFTLDEVRQTVRTILENFIGSRQTDVSPSVIKETIRKALEMFVRGGSLLNAVVDKVVREGVGYRAYVRVIPAEALEFIALEVLAERAPTG